MRFRSSTSVASLMAVLAVFSALPLSAQDEQVDERFSMVVQASGSGASGTRTSADVDVTRWSTAAEREVLREALAEGGSEALWEAIRQQAPTGSFGVQGEERGFRLRYAEDLPQPDGGRLIILAADRPIEIEGVADYEASAEHRITMIELRLDASGAGAGYMSLGAELAFEGGNLIIKNSETRPFELTNVKRRN